MSAIEEVLQECMKIQEERGKVYDRSFNQTGLIYKALLPNGIELNTAEDMALFAALGNVIMKLNRFCANIHDGGHDDSAVDLVNYAAILVHRSRAAKRVHAGRSQVRHDDSC